LGKRLRWEEQFGYALVPEPRNLDALRDGFISDEWGSEPFVLEVYEAERAWREDSRWFLGVLSIAMEHSLVQLALGHRFFVVLILERASRLIGREIERIWVPNIYRTAGRDFNA
jgi:hypothetical protein